MFSFRLSGALLPESECKVTPKNLPHQIFRKENYTTKTNFFNKPLQFSTISHQKKSQKKRHKRCRSDFARRIQTYPRKIRNFESPLQNTRRRLPFIIYIVILWPQHHSYTCTYIHNIHCSTDNQASPHLSTKLSTTAWPE